MGVETKVEGLPTGSVFKSKDFPVLNIDWKKQAEEQRAVEFAYGLNLFLKMMKERPDFVVTTDKTQSLTEFVGFSVTENGIRFNNDFQLESAGTLRMAADRHTRIDSGKSRVPGTNYAYSVFFNTEFKDGEPVFPSHVPYSQRPTTARVRKAMGRKKIKEGGGNCGCGGHCCGH